MNKLIYFLIFVLCISLTYAEQTSNSKYDIQSFHSSSSLINQNLSNYTINFGAGQPVTGNRTTANYTQLLGIYYFHNITKTDTTAPIITITSPISTTYSTQNITINFSATDASGISNLWYFNGTGETNYSTSHSIILPDGAYTFYFLANDTLGNLANESVGFTIDTSVPVIPSQGGSTGIQKIPCNLTSTPIEVTFDTFKLTQTIDIKNLYESSETFTVFLPPVPTLFGLRPYLTSDIENKVIPPDDTGQFTISLNNTVGIREDILTNIIIESDRCSSSIPLIIKKFPAVFYDIRVVTDKIIYNKPAIVNISVLIENKGDTPDKDTNLKLSLISPNGDKVQFIEEKLKEVLVGVTKLSREIPIESNAKSGLYKVFMEYETEAQGLLTSEYTFYVMPFSKSVLFFSIIIIILVIISIRNSLLLHKFEEKEEEKGEKE